MIMTMTMARVRRRGRVVRKILGKGREQRMRRGKGRAKKRGRGRHQRKGRERGRETVKGKVWLNKPQGEMISLVLLLGSCRRNCIGQTRTGRAN
jgi:hypothetical protein